MLTEVGIDKQKKNTSVEELGDEDHVGNRGKSLTVSVLTNPLDQFNDEHFENCVNNDNEESDTGSEYFGHKSVFVVNFT